MSKQKSYNLYRMMFPEFIYESFQYDVQSDGLHIAFCFRLNESICFEPTAFIPCRPFLNFGRLNKDTLDMLVFHIGMIELISYWKAYCPPTVVVKPFRLDAKQVEFWKKLYYNGLGEFFYTNGIRATQDDFLNFRFEGSCAAAPIAQRLFSSDNGQGRAEGTHIVPIGGGKDSVVTLEIISQHERPLPLIMNPRGATEACVACAGYTMDDVLVIKRTIHPRLLELNRQGALNGHTPFSAMLAFYTLLASALTGCRPNIALSNENSANESTVAGSYVNHQYSKSLEFENDFRRYVYEYLSPEYNYYSFLRPLSELQIASLFSRHTKYHPVFKSCNVGSKEDIWCGHCAKCLFAYIILSPFMEPERLNAVFGKNMLDDISLQHEFLQLTGNAETKPFECVGTVSEVNSALSMTLAKWYPTERPALLRDYKPQPATTPLDSLFEDHNLPKDDFELLSKALQGGQVEHLFRYGVLFNMLAGKEILIAGYGREGKSSHMLLQRMFPARSYDVAHNDEEIISALQRKHYDMILKSPGIPNALFEGRCDKDLLSSQSDIFLRVYGDLTVGITGTKGKSTTTQLVFKALKDHSEKPVILAGNIGIPFFDILDQLQPGCRVVAELSCHQLENIHRAPATAVILNFFEEHLDHYHDYADYQNAKLQIALRQQAGDCCFFCSDNDDLRSAMQRNADCFKGDVVPYALDDAKHSDLLKGATMHLVGDHNLSNIYVAWLVSHRLGLSGCDFLDALADFHGLEHRLERVATVDGVTYYNDSISTIPQATIEALSALKNVKTLILGGFNRGIDYEPLARFLTSSPIGKAVANLVFWGGAGREMKALFDALEPHSDRRMLCHFESDYRMDEAVAFAAQYTGEGSICLLSPAASSYDHYKNFEERGGDFKRCVNALPADNTQTNL